MNGKPRFLLKHPTPEEKLLFVLTRQRFDESHRQTVRRMYQHDEIDWDVIYATAMLHRVAPLVYNNLLQCTGEGQRLPPQLHDSLKQAYLSNVAIKNFRARQIEAILSALNQRSIDVMLVKGVALDMLVYDHPWLTISDDVDLLLRPHREALSVSEREMINALIRSHSHGMRFFEIGYFAHPDVTMHGALPIDFRTIWQDAQTILYRGQRTYVMCPEDLLITACINSCRKRFFKLKALCDIATIIDSYHALDWTAVVYRARIYACHAMVFTALLITQATVGCNVPGQVFDDLAIGPIKARIIRYLGEHGSFASLPSLFAGRNVLGRSVGPALLLPCATYRWDQAWRYLGVVLRMMARYARQPARDRHQLKLPFSR